MTVDGSNNVTGKYTSAVSGSGGPTPSTDLRGTVTGDLIAFTVNWGSAITTWAGHGVFDANNQPQILTLWHLVVSIADETDPQQQWDCNGGRRHLLPIAARNAGCRRREASGWGSRKLGPAFRDADGSTLVRWGRTRGTRQPDRARDQ